MNRNRSVWRAACAALAVWATLAACERLTLTEEPTATADTDEYPLIQGLIDAALDDALVAADLSAARRAKPDSRYQTLVRMLTEARDGALATALALQLPGVTHATDAELAEMEALIADDPVLQAKIVALTDRLKAAFAAIPPIDVRVQPLDGNDNPIGQPYVVRSEHGAIDLGSSVITVPEFLLRVQGQQGRPERGFAIDDQWWHADWGEGGPWPSATVNYYFYGLSISEEQWMTEAMERMTNGTGMSFAKSRKAEWWNEFLYWLGSNQNLRINKEQLSDIPGWATVGKLNNARLVMDTQQVTEEMHFNHEMGHVFGLLHEHQRYDRSTYVTVSSAKKYDTDYRIIPERVRHCFLWGLSCWYEDSSTTYSTPYDYQSIMHYRLDITLKRNHLDWDDNEDNNARWGDENGNTWFTPWDIYTIKKRYGITPNPRPGYTPAAAAP